MKKGFKLSMIAIALQVLGLQNTNAGCDRDEIILGGSGGHDVPTPFQVRKTKFELADGEIYSLVGTLVIAPSYKGDSKKLRPYFSINLDSHPLLANANRVASPLYMIEGSADYLNKWEGESINILCQAHGRILVTDKGFEYAIHLVPLGVESFSIQYPGLEFETKS